MNFAINNLIFQYCPNANAKRDVGAIGGGMSRDNFIDNVAEDILKNLPKLFDVMRIKKAFQVCLFVSLQFKDYKHYVKLNKKGF